MSKNPNDHFIATARAAIRLAELDLSNSMNVILANLQIANLAAVAKIALEKEVKTVRDSNGRPVVDLETDGSGCDAFFSKGTYDDDGSEVGEDELNYLTESYPETLEEESHQSAVCAAEYAFEGDR